MKKYIFTRLVMVFMICFAMVSTVFAEYVGNETAGADSTQTLTVAEINRNPIEDQKIVLEGFITSKIRRERYTFTDGTESIRVEIDDHDFPKSPVDENTKVRIHGKVDVDFGQSLKLDIKKVEIIN